MRSRDESESQIDSESCQIALVIDVDPRNFDAGDDPLERLCTDTGLDRTLFPIVSTGGGGLHIYMTKPIGVSLPKTSPKYKGIDFLSGSGQQVVAPGSVHPKSGELYRWDCNGREQDIWLKLADMPSKLADVLIDKPIKVSADKIAKSDIDPEYLEKCLEALDPENFRDQDGWLKLMMAYHEASGGLAEAEFIEWSTSDPAYAHDTEIVRARWKSLGAHKGAAITRRTLFKHLAEAGRRELIPTDSDVLPNSHAMTIAKAILEEMPRTVRCNAQWYQFNRERNVYVQLKEEAFKAVFWNLIEGRRYLDDKGNTRGLVSKRHTVADVMEAAMALCMAPGEPHCWLDPKPNDPPADEIVVCANGLLHLPTREVLPATNQFFGVNSTPIAYDPNAPEPQRFVQFLQEVFPNEADCREGLMEMAGLLLTRDTSYQKVFQLVGPTRSGKGTLIRVILSIVGDGNHTSPTTSNLSGRFGLAPLINKQVAVLSDMRMGGRIDRSNLLETLLRVSGEDPVSIERKGIDNIEARLTTRFVLVSNEILQLRDTADAIGARMILFVMRESFSKREDQGLGQKLELELPGILNMALDGLARLRERGHFIQPKSASAEAEMMHRLTRGLLTLTLVQSWLRRAR